MTDNTTTADKVQEVINFLTEHVTKGAGDYAIDYANAIEYCLDMLNDIATPPTLADKLREYAENILAGGSVSDVKHQLILFADRVETLEKERDIATDTLKAEAEVTTEFLYRNKVLADDLAAARLVVDEQVAEIARLRAREIPDGWRLADHPDYGTVIADPKEYSDGDVIIRYLNENKFVEARLISAHALSFRDEAPAPEPERIAADTIQYGVEYDHIAARPDWPDSTELCYLTEDMDLWVPEIEIAKEALDDFRDRNPYTTYRLIARRVSPTWEVKE